MKIYNEIILKWNEITQQYDSIYEDSYEYNGPIYKMGDEDEGYGGGEPGGEEQESGDSGGSGQTTGGTDGSENDTPQNTDDEYTNLWSNENLEEYREVLSNRISQLILSKWTEIENITGLTGVEDIQKTFREGKLEVGRNKNETMVVYAFDNDANADSGHVLDSIIN